MSFASEKNKVAISESEVPPTLSTNLFPCHGDQGRGKRKFSRGREIK